LSSAVAGERRYYANPSMLTPLLGERHCKRILASTVNSTSSRAASMLESCLGNSRQANSGRPRRSSAGCFARGTRGFATNKPNKVNIQSTNSNNSGSSSSWKVPWSPYRCNCNYESRHASSVYLEKSSVGFRGVC
jgi:hypothetical protein